MHDFWDRPRCRHRDRGRGGRFRLFVLRRIGLMLVHSVIRQFAFRLARTTRSYDYRENPGAALRWLVENGHIRYRAQGVAQLERGHFPMEATE